MKQLPAFDASNLQDICKYYEENGMVIVKLLNEEMCDALLLEQWRQVLLRQPWREEFLIKVTNDDGRILMLDDKRDRSEFLRIIKAPLSKERRQQFERGWCLHRGFGACCDPAVFHLPLVWKIRQDPNLYTIAAHLLGREDLWVDINRSIQKLPGQGDDEFLHWDFNPFAPSSQTDHLTPHQVCGKVCYTPSRFVAVPGTHSPAFHAKFVAQYQQHYQHVKPSDSKFGLRTDRPDPLGLTGRREVFEIPAGCAVLWSPALLHGQVKTPLSAPTEYGCYVGYAPAGARPAYAARCGADELADRLDSFRRGRAPRLWPSLDTVHYYPRRFANFPRILQGYVDRMPPAHPSVASRRTAAGVLVPHLEPPPPPADYAPPRLTALGRRLLGEDPWPPAAGRPPSTAEREGGGGGGGGGNSNSAADKVVAAESGAARIGAAAAGGGGGRRRKAPSGAAETDAGDVGGAAAEAAGRADGGGRRKRRRRDAAPEH